MATLAQGVSKIHNRLQSADVDSAIVACRGFGASIEESGDTLTVTGTNGTLSPKVDEIDVGNSGTTANFVLSMAALSPKPVTITADEQTRKRPVLPLLRTLEQLGATIVSTNGGKLPVRLHGPMKGGGADVNGSTSQYLSSVLIHSPFCAEGTTLRLESLNEKPYVDMTLDWMKKLGVVVEQKNYDEFFVPPRQTYKSFESDIPGDFSTSAFFFIAAALPKSEVDLEGLDMHDVQGDKEIVNYLKFMGADIEAGETFKVSGKLLTGREIDLNATPDALPAMAVAACLAKGTTRLTNVPQARIKETDRIAVMAAELKKMGADITEEEHGLLINGGRPLKGAALDGHYDHRVVMSLAVAGMAAEGETTITTAEAINITFPNFVEFMKNCGAKIGVE